MFDLNLIQEKFPSAVTQAVLDKGQAVATISADSLLAVLKFCKEDPNMAMDILMDVIGVDFLGQSPRFELVYLLYSTSKKHRLRLKLRVDENQSVPTASPIYKSADWAEREIYDMYGIKFSGHPNLKRILLYEGFVGHPLRRDYVVNHRQKIPQIEEIP